MDTSLKGRDLLSLADLSPEELTLILDTATAQKRAWASGVRETPLAGMAIAIILQKPSMRTRVSFEVGIARLGAHPGRQVDHGHGPGGHGGRCAKELSRCDQRDGSSEQTDASPDGHGPSEK